MARLKYALANKHTELMFKEERHQDAQSVERFTNRYTRAALFPDEDIVKTLKNELKTLKVSEYIETVKDLDYPQRSEMRVFGRSYSQGQVYIKFRVDMFDQTSGNYQVRVISFHFAEYPFVVSTFPYGS